MGVSLAKYYYALKFYRKMAAKAAKGALWPHQKMILWRSAAMDLKKWKNDVSQNVPRPTNPTNVTTPVKEIFVDASDVGFAILNQKKHHVLKLLVTTRISCSN